MLGDTANYKKNTIEEILGKYRAELQREELQMSTYEFYKNLKIDYSLESYLQNKL